MKVLQVSAYSLGRRGGVQSHVRALATALASRGHEVRCLSPPPDRAAPDDCSQGFEPVGSALQIRLSGTGFELCRIGRREMGVLARDLLTWKPDIIHAHGVWVPMIPLQVFSAVPAARVVTFHDTTGPGLEGIVLRRVFSAASRMIARRTQGMIATSATPLAHLGPACAICPVTVVPPAIDLSPFCAIPLGQEDPPPQPDILHWGRLEQRKNIRLLTDAARLIWHGGIEWPAPLPKPRFLISGEGPEAHYVAATAAALGPRAVQLLPPLSPPELLAQLAKASLCVFPARHGESFGIVLAEALASGVPVLAGRNAGFAQMLGPLGAEMLVDPDDAAALAKSIRDHLVQPKPELPATCRAHALGYDISRHIDQIETIYETAVYTRFSNGDGAGYQR